MISIVKNGLQILLVNDLDCKSKPAKVSDGKFTTNGNFFKLTRVLEEYVENGETKTKYTVKSENLGKNIKVDDYAK